MRLRPMIDAGGPSVGGWCSIPSAFCAELMGRAGFDWVGIDTQHGLVGYPEMATMLQALAVTGTPGLVRVSWNSPGEIGKALDAGAQGVIVPMVNTPEDAVRAVAACRYPPQGERSYGPVRAAFGLDDYSPASANRDVTCIVQVETRQAVDLLPDILAVGGIDVAYVGPADLAVSYGFAPTFAVPDMQHLDVIDKVLQACRDAGTVAGIHCTAASDVVHWIDQGFGFVTAGSDRGYMARAATAELDTIRRDSHWKGALQP
jgi:4-hydroxy-2-oxoheptanedioate aldolase